MENEMTTPLDSKEGVDQDHREFIMMGLGAGAMLMLPAAVSAAGPKHKTAASKPRKPWAPASSVLWKFQPSSSTA